MGEFLSHPIKDKISEDFESSYVKNLFNFQIRYGASGMQGWRKKMEDSHIADLNFLSDRSMSVFGVFDGHGGNKNNNLRKGSFTIC